MTLLTCLLLLAATACTAVQGMKGHDLISVMDSLPLSTLLKLLQTADLESGLVEDGPFTVLAPSDEAFAKLNPEVLASILADPKKLSNILTYHVIPGTASSLDIIDGLKLETLLGKMVNFTIVDGAVMVNDVATVINADVKATNGLIHVIDEVLMPPEDMESKIDEMMDDEMMDGTMSPWRNAGHDDEMEGSGYNDEEDTQSMDLVDLALAEGLSTLVFLVQFAGLLDTLREAGPFTIFAPHDSAGFSTLDPHVMDRAMTDPDFLVELLSYHVIPGQRLLSSDVDGDLSVATLGGGAIDLSLAQDGGLLLNGGNATVMYSDMLASNGVLHIIDRVLVPGHLMVTPGTVVEVAEEKRLNTFLELVKEADLAEALSGPGPYTVFAPVDDAFADLPEELLQQLKDDPSELQKVLLYHVVEGVVTSQDFENDLLMPSLQGQALRLNIYPKVTGVGMVTVDGSPVLRLDVTASNGVLHLMERVLLPPQGTVADLVTKEEDLSTFVKALTAANMTEYLKGEGPLTVLAPVDAAFAALPEGTLDTLLEDQELLKKVLEEHIIPLTVYKEGMCWSSVPSLGGPPIAFGKDASSAPVLASPMTVTGLHGMELFATNGVIHKIKDVLFS